MFTMSRPTIYNIIIPNIPTYDVYINKDMIPLLNNTDPINAKQQKNIKVFNTLVCALYFAI